MPFIMEIDNNKPTLPYVINSKWKGFSSQFRTEYNNICISDPITNRIIITSISDDSAVRSLLVTL